MIFIMGESIKAKVVEEGSFECPICQRRQDYAHLQEKTYFTIMFIPTFPLGLRGDYLVCSGCKHSFDPQDKSEPSFVMAMQMTYAYLLNCYSDLDGRAIVQQVHQELCLKSWDNNSIRDAMQAIPDWSNFQKRIKPVLVSLNYPGRIKVIEAALRFIHQLTQMSHDDRVIINMIASQLEVDPQETQKLALQLLGNQTG